MLIQVSDMNRSSDNGSTKFDINKYPSIANTYASSQQLIPNILIPSGQRMHIDSVYKPLSKQVFPVSSSEKQKTRIVQSTNSYIRRRHSSMGILG